MKIGGRPLRYIQRVPCTNPVAVARVGHQFPTPPRQIEVMQKNKNIVMCFGYKNSETREKRITQRIVYKYRVERHK